MNHRVVFRRHGGPLASLVLVVLWLCVAAAHAAAMGKLHGRIVATDNGEPVGFADLVLLPADSTLHPVGMLTNADGTFLLEAAPGRYTLQIRALSYTKKLVAGIEIEEGQLLPFSTALTPEALEQEEVVVEARRLENTDASMLSARKKAAAVGDAISAEQVRKSADKDAAEVLKRVTGLSVADGKFVFVRGLGERYSSTEVDGVRIGSPEQNKRVVPLDLFPSNLLDNIVVQKTYTADRPGEFGGGDVQVKTRDFPGQRTWSLSASQGFAEGVTFEDRMTSGSYRRDLFGFSAGARDLPAAVHGIDLPSWNASTLPELAAMGRTFRNTWSPSSATTIPNGSYAVTYGDEFRLFDRPLGLIQSWSTSRSFDKQEESQRFFLGTSDTLYDYAVTRWTESLQLGGLAGLSYRWSPRHSFHARGLFTRSADDEVRVYQGEDHNNTEATTGTWITRRNTRLMYVQRDVLSGSVEGKHDFSGLLGSHIDWKLTGSRARRQQPDRRELTYNQRYYFEGDTAHWVLGSTGRRDFGDMTDDGWGATVSGSIPYRLGGLGTGKLTLGYDQQTKERDNFYRRFNLVVDPRFIDAEAPAESIFAAKTFHGDRGSGYVGDATLDQPLVGIDNYRARQRIDSGYLSLDVPFGRRVRGNFGIRVESGYQNVESFALFAPDVILQKGELDNTDWLPSANLTWAMTDAINVRLAASQTVSRPDLNELSPSPFLDYIGGMLVSGNPDLRRARLENYDARLEAFPGINEVLAVGFFHKNLREPIEQVIQGGTPPLLIPRNSARGQNRGIELEARTRLGRVWSGLDDFSLNSNASFIASEVELQPQLSPTGTAKHPLQGQADYLVNIGLSYTQPEQLDVSLLLNASGKRLRTLGLDPLPDVYQQPFTTLDATVSLQLFGNRIKLSGKNLLDPKIQELQNGKEVSGYRSGRSFSISFSVGS